ncbi:hypothetical protein [Photobacterium lutimaris]|uniref:TetR/AcrR family transcriptional regulator n=1 Tax=Photobacterium lutimaris TaxID=388278 RepID=A0A2T3J4K1_9GAMM|nr:hypothetical protein [Photobacterium lutimaris]PSU36224.1 hypothetical protein C9I99_04275 [Photobacterium lutimaris]TDR74902.1 hypothetical protein DFP78_106233 [Photobacterium lutimaris]
MARISAKERQEKLEFINQKIFELFLREGFGSLTFYNIAEETGIRQSTLQSYHKTHTIPEALTGKVAPYFMSKLDMSNLSAFRDSWMTALNDSGFRNILSLLVGHITTADNLGELAGKGLLGLIAAIEAELGEEGRKSLNELMGLSVIEIALSKIDSTPKG